MVYQYKYKEQGNGRGGTLIGDAQRGNTRKSIPSSLLYKLVLYTKQFFG